MSSSKKRINIRLSPDILTSSGHYLKNENEVDNLTKLIEKALIIFLKDKNYYPPRNTDIKLNEQQLDEYRECGIIDETGVRNYYIRKEIDKRQAESKKGKALIIEELAKELIMTTEAVHDIYYRKQKRNKPFFELIRKIE